MRVHAGRVLGRFHGNRAVTAIGSGAVPCPPGRFGHRLRHVAAERAASLSFTPHQATLRSWPPGGAATAAASLQHLVGHAAVALAAADWACRPRSANRAATDSL